jgi:hypothetical protein
MLYKLHPYKKSFYKLILFSLISALAMFLFRSFNIHYIIKLFLSVGISILINYLLIYKFALEEDDQLIIDKIVNKFR